MRLNLRSVCAHRLLLLTAPLALLVSACPSGPQTTIQAISKGVVQAVAFSPDGRSVASAGTGGEIKLWNVETARLKQSLEGHPHLIYSLAFSPDGRALVSGDQDGMVKFWDISAIKLR